MNRLAGLMLGTVLTVAGLSEGRAELTRDEALAAYLRTILVEEVIRQAQGLIKDADEGVRAEVAAELETWAGERRESIRRHLVGRAGDARRARTDFESFVAAYTAAEARKDHDYLRALSRELDWSDLDDYAALRARASAEWLSEDTEAAARFLSVVQTWLDQRRKGISTGPLSRWLAYASRPEPAPPTPQTLKATDPLARAEPTLGEFQDSGEVPPNPREAFTKTREERRTRISEEARIAMQQVAEERRAAEEEWAQKKQAEAQADAEAVRRHAEQLTATEQLAQEQRQKTWGNRLKKIVGATVSAATGAFTGAVGTRAGEEAAAALFGD